MTVPLAEANLRTATAVPRLGSAADFFAGHSNPAASALAAGRFVGSIATPRKLSQIVALLDADAAFDEAYTSLPGSTAGRVREVGLPHDPLNR